MPETEKMETMNKKVEGNKIRIQGLELKHKHARGYNNNLQRID